MDEIMTIGNYQFETQYCIGQGSFGKVYKGINIQTQKKVAVKEIDINLCPQQFISKEIQILKKLKHKNIVQYEDAFQKDGYYYIITEYCNGGDLRNMMGDSDDEEQMNVDKLLEMFYQVCEGFNYLKKHSIVHRDMKPSNILINNGIYKIADFGMARTNNLNKSLMSNDLMGVPIYMSPQILTRNYYTYKCDVWAMGIIVYELYYDELPWKAKDVDSLFFQIMKNPTPYLNKKKKLLLSLKKIFEGTLQYLEKDRLDWDQLISLKKGRRKIFGEEMLRSKSTGLGRNSNNLTMTQMPQTAKIQSDLSSKKNFDPSVYRNWQSKAENQLLRHIRAQIMAEKQQLSKIISQQCLTTFQSTLDQYIEKNQSKRQLFNDCGKMFLKQASLNLHLYLLQLQSLQEARDLLILLQLLHDMISSSRVDKESLSHKLDVSRRGDKIEIYAAEVISKINTFHSFS